MNERGRGPNRRDPWSLKDAARRPSSHERMGVYADCCVAVDETVTLAKGTLALASSFIKSREALSCPSHRA